MAAATNGAPSMLSVQFLLWDQLQIHRKSSQASEGSPGSKHLTCGSNVHYGNSIASRLNSTGSPTSAADVDASGE